MLSSVEKELRKFMGGSLFGIGVLVWLLIGIIALVVDVQVVIVGLGWGFIGGVAAILFFPLTLALAPWYALIALSNPIPLIITYPAGFLGMIIMAVGRTLAGDD